MVVWEFMSKCEGALEPLSCTHDGEVTGIGNLWPAGDLPDGPGVTRGGSVGLSRRKSPEKVPASLELSERPRFGIVIVVLLRGQRVKQSLAAMVAMVITGPVTGCMRKQGLYEGRRAS